MKGRSRKVERIRLTLAQFGLKPIEILIEEKVKQNESKRNAM